mgnify:FL=1
MKKNLKFLSGILMASFISNITVDTSNFAKARVSRTVVVNATSNDLNNNSNDSQEEISTRSSETEVLNENTDLETTSEESLTEDETLLDENGNVIEENENSEESLEDEDTDEEDSESETTNILQMLNSDDSVTVDEIVDLAKPMSYGFEFINEFDTTFPDFDPLRVLSDMEGELNSYVDVNLNEPKTITKYLNDNTTTPSIYSEQNTCNMLLGEIKSLLEEINEEISLELPSTIFSLMPTVLVFEDTYKILFAEYNSIINSNSKNQISLNILLKDVKENLVSLLKTINEFKSQLPDLIDTLNEVAESFDSSTNTSDKNTTDDEELDEELTEEDGLIEENIEEEITEEDSEEEIIEEDTEEEITGEDAEEETTEEEVEEETTEEEVEEETTEEEIEEEVDPNSVIVYFGDQGQELIYDERTKKYYQLDPENPDSEDLIEYNGEVTKMTLAEYLDTDLFFDSEGNELIYDLDTNSYFLYDSETDEFVVYEGEVTKMKLKDLLESNQ